MIMKAFISYSHANAGMLEILHKHLAQLQRDRLVSTWSDNEIAAGDIINKSISYALDSSNLFIALLSPDYIASQYCYVKEFEKALEMQEEGRLIIIPIIIEPCDWLNTPFKQFKALPKDGKAVSEWQNINTAFLDITQNIRKLITLRGSESDEVSLEGKSALKPISRNYRVKQDFDSIQKMEFVERNFEEVGTYIKNYIQEVILIDNIKARVIKDTKNELEYLLVNRNKIANNESLLKVRIGAAQSGISFYNSSDKNPYV